MTSTVSIHPLFVHDPIPFLEKSIKLKQATASLGAALRLALLLHDLTDLDARVEELGGAAVEADGLALVEFGLAVVGGDALLLAGVLETVLFRCMSVT